MTRKSSKHAAASAASLSSYGDQPANSRQRPALIALAVLLGLMFLTSFLFRMQTPGLQVERQSARKSTAQAAPQEQPGMPPGMAQGMPPGMPQGMPPGAQGAPSGAAGMPPAGAMPGGMPQAGQMSEESMAAIGDMMRRMSENPNDPKLLFELGERFMASNSFEKAAVFFRRALVTEPSNTEYLDNLGMCMYELGRYQEAFGYFSQITAQEKENAQAFLNLGVLKKLLGEPEEAKKFFQTVIDMPSAKDVLKTKAKKQIEELKEHGATPAGDKKPETKSN